MKSQYTCIYYLINIKRIELTFKYTVRNTYILIYIIRIYNILIYII